MALANACFFEAIITRIFHNITLFFSQHGNTYYFNFKLSLFRNTLQKKNLFASKNSLFIFFICCNLLVFTSSIVVIQNNGLENRFSREVLDNLNKENTWIPPHGINPKETSNGYYYSIGIEIEDTENITEDFVIWGDSHAQSIWNIVDETAREQGRAGILAVHHGIPPILNVWTRQYGESGRQLNQEVFDTILNNKIKNVILVANWDIYTADNPKYTITDDAKKFHTSEESIGIFKESLSYTIKLLNENRVKVYILLNVPRQKDDVPLWMTRMIISSKSPELEYPSIRRSYKEYLTMTSDEETIIRSFESDGTFVVDLSPYVFDDKGYSFIIQDGKSLYNDDDHLSPRGALLLRPLFLKIMEEIQ